MNEPYDIIKTASLTEKSTLLTEKQNKYVFRVSPKANKIQIKNAIERLFEKTVVDVNTCNYAGKEKRLRGPLGRRPRWKKAIVTLKEGDKIDLIVDDGAARIDRPSTVVDARANEAKLIREGVMAWAEIQKALNRILPLVEG